MSKKLYVGNISFRVSEGDLAEFFRAAGTVETASIITDRMSGRSKGFGFVEMATEEEAQKAISMFHDKDFQGRNLVVNVAQPREERPRREGGGGFRGDRGDRGGRSGGGGFGGGGREDRPRRW